MSKHSQTLAALNEEQREELLRAGQVYIAELPKKALTSKQLEEFLTELMNLRRQDPTSVSRFVNRYADFGLYEPRLLMPTRGEDSSPQTTVEDLFVPYLHDMFTACWIEPDSKQREWGWMIFWTQSTQIRFPDLRSSLRDEGGRKRFPPRPSESGLEKAFQYLVKQHHRTRYCPNTECAAPYFLARRPSQRYCSEKCAQRGERETKRRWWAEHGADWRKKQKRAVATSKRPRKSATKGRKVK
jgi:hypothetical protein